MTFPEFLRRGLSRLLVPLVLTALVSSAASDRILKPNPTLARETVTLIRLLEEVHYNRDGVRPSDYNQVIPDYMAELDGQRLFFLSTDKESFAKRFPTQWLYNNIASLGVIDPAYDIFALYRQRVSERFTWALTELSKDIDLNTSETYLLDRSKALWPDDLTSSDDLWRKRIKFDILQEVLNKKTVEEAKQNVRKRYERRLKDLDDIDSDDVAEIFLSTIARLYDPHSTYFSAPTFEDFSIQMRLQLVGIGALLGIEDDYCVIKEVITGGPADLSKQFKPNDKILAVSQETGEPVDVIGMKLRRIVEQIRGKKGSKVKLTIQPADAPDPSVRKEIVLVRDLVNLDSSRAHGAIFDVPDDTGKTSPIGVITLPAFYGPDGSDEPGAEKNSATKDVAELITRLKTAGINGLVLDLRQNGGGLLSEAIDLTGLFIKKGPVVQVKNIFGEVKVDSDDDPSIAYSGPLAVLVSKFSASASEIVAGALQDYGRGVVIGDSSTHGKGSVQTILEMKNMPSLAHSPVKTGATKITVQKFYLPDGHSTQLKGVVSDIVLPSIDEFLPLGEKDLPHALIWDEIPTSYFDGKPLDPKVVAPLREASVGRQAKLDEFAYLAKNIEWFKAKQEQKFVSLNLEERRHQKELDTAFKKTMDAEKERLSKNEYTFREYTLGQPRKPKPKVEKPAPKDGDADSTELSTDDNDTYGKMDIPLRESLRVLNDAVEMGRRPELWASDHPPLTIADKKS